MSYHLALPAPALALVAALGLAAGIAPATAQTEPAQAESAQAEPVQANAAQAQTQASAAAQNATAQTTTAQAAPATEQYQRRIRQAITPDEVRHACSAPNGSLTIGDEIVVCAERDPQQRYRVPGETVTRPVDPAQDSPVARANRVMKANDDAPVGTNAEKPRGALNPFALGKWLKSLGEKATEEEE